MISILNTNLEFFRQRFPALYEITDRKPSETAVLSPAKNGELTACENGLWLHSRYNPSSEAEKLTEDFDEELHETALFLGCGLLYAPEVFAEKHPDANIIIVEKDQGTFFSALESRNLEKLFTHKKLAIVLTEDAENASSVIKNYPASKIKIFAFPNLIQKNREWYATIIQSVKKTAEREKVNTKTLEKFSSLWLKNSCKNLRYSFTLDGVNKFHQTAGDLPFTVIAAGPSLETLIPYLKEIKKKSIIVCVDTALHALLANDIQPDFVVLVDPQYICALHLEFLSAPESILIAESAVYPSVLRFNCKETILCSSNFPMGKYFENLLGEKGRLGAGGSVATVAWDFARYCGAKQIFMAALDLGFPGKQTHIKGSQFEEKAHVTSDRMTPAETFSANYIMSAPLKKAVNYDQKEILTDLRMSIFSSWFEASCKNAENSGQKTYSLTKESLAINGITPFSIEDFLKLEDLGTKRSEFYSKAAAQNLSIKRQLKENNTPAFDTVLESFTENLNFLIQTAEEGYSLCRNAVTTLKKHKQLNLSSVFMKLDGIDRKILSSSAKNAAALVFPTKEQLDSLCTNLSEDKNIRQFEYSGIVYECILKACRAYLSQLKDC
ncbi:MAG: motility associated factor glycosyltransferase family protein [Treponema sp.]|nr:motility associated factor glycosyltransferase family protein [Treponema sp.]